MLSSNSSTATCKLKFFWFFLSYFLIYIDVHIDRIFCPSQLRVLNGRCCILISIQQVVTYPHRPHQLLRAQTALLQIILSYLIRLQECFYKHVIISRPFYIFTLDFASAFKSWNILRRIMKKAVLLVGLLCEFSFVVGKSNIVWKDINTVFVYVDKLILYNITRVESLNKTLGTFEFLNIT